MVSVIIPLYNKKAAIRNTLHSVLGQTYKKFEVIVVDDGSTDNSASIVEEEARKDQRIKLFRKKNGGVSSARNFGLKQSVGDWIVFLDADDEMLPTNLETLMGLANKYHVQLCAANVLLSGRGGSLSETELRNSKEKVYGNYVKALLRHQGIFASGASMYCRKLLGDKPYREDLSRYEDCEFELNLFAKSHVAFSPIPVMIHHQEFAELSKIKSDSHDKDFIFNMNFIGKTFWQKVRMAQFINEGCYTYPNGSQQLKSKYGRWYYWKYIYLFVSKYYSAMYKINKFFRIH